MAEKNQKKDCTKRRKLRLEDVKKVMSKAEMKAYASACRIENGTAEPEDYKIVKRYEEALAASQVSAFPQRSARKGKATGL